MSTPGFWAALPRPLLGLAPMDGVTNAPYRRMVARYGSPDVLFTEFVPVEGLMHRAARLLADFCYHPSERPMVAQIYGTDPDSFYAVAHLLCDLGFDGIDINMGCPARNVASRGAGAGLIRTPQRAQAIVAAVRRGITDWCDGQSPEAAGVPAVIGTRARELIGAAGSVRCGRSGEVHAGTSERRPIPISIKTRIGYDRSVVTTWIPQLLEMAPAAISLHGRTLQQMYRGAADWEAIATAVDCARGTSTLLIGNGDVETLEGAAERVRHSGVQGVLIGRGSMGRPWIFGPKATWRSVLRGDAPMTSLTALMPSEMASCAPDPVHCLLEHAQLLEDFAQQVDRSGAFTMIKRLIKPYLTGQPDGAALRSALYACRSAAEMERVLTKEYISYDPSDCA